MTEMPICIGCGVKIQTENPEEPGYAPPKTLEKETNNLPKMFSVETL